MAIGLSRPANGYFERKADCPRTVSSRLALIAVGLCGGGLLRRYAGTRDVGLGGSAAVRDLGRRLGARADAQATN